MHGQRRSLWLWLALLGAAKASSPATTPDPLSGSSDSALTTAGPDQNSSTGTFTWTGTDSTLVREVQACESEKRAWYTASSNWYWSTHSSYSYTSTTAYDTLWLGNYTGPVSTLCDGVPRGSGPAPTKTIATTVYVNSSPPPFPHPSPTCTFNWRGCELVVSSYRSYHATSHALTDTPPAPPLCEYGPDECKIPYGEDNCQIDAGYVQLLYWPSSKDPTELCASTKPTITPAPTPTEPVIAVSDGHTFSSPFVYLSFSELKGLPCYRTWSNAVVAVPSQSLSTIVFGETQPIERTTALNWNDMNSPVPMSAYKAQQSCWKNWLGVRATASGADNCNTIYDDYLPWLALPTNPAFFTDLDPIFANCTKLAWRDYVFDPPYALTPVGDLLPPTATATTTTKHIAESAVLPSAAMTTISQPRYARGPIATAGTQVISADPHNPHNILIDGHVMKPGQVSAIGTTPLIMQTGAVIIGSSTISLPASVSQQPVATVGSQVIVADGENFIFADGNTLAPGTVTVINRITVSVVNSALVIGGSSTVSMAGQGAVLTAGSRTITAHQATPGVVVVGSHTLTAGGSAATISGMVVSAGNSSIVAVVDGTTTTAAVSSLPRESSATTTTTTSSVPGVGWATDQAPSSASSTTSGASTLYKISFWTAVLSFAAMLLAV